MEIIVVSGSTLFMNHEKLSLFCPRSAWVNWPVSSATPCMHNMHDVELICIYIYLYQKVWSSTLDMLFNFWDRNLERKRLHGFNKLFHIQWNLSYFLYLYIFLISLTTGEINIFFRNILLVLEEIQLKSICSFMSTIQFFSQKTPNFHFLKKISCICTKSSIHLQIIRCY